MNRFLSIVIAIQLAAFGAKAQKLTLTPLWESDTTLTTPECVLYEPKENVLYVACINGKPNIQNKNSFISKISPTGKVLKLKLTEGINCIKGMGIIGKKLYVTEMTNVVEIELTSGKILNRYPVDNAKFLNDISVDAKKGNVYISDSGTAKIWLLKNGAISLVLEGQPLKGTNGVLVEGNQLLIGNGDGTLLSMNISTKKLTPLGKVSGGIDGITALGNKKYIVSEWGGKVWQVNANGTTELLIDSTKEKINTADLTYNAKTKTLYVPTFFHNTVKAYSVK